MAEGEADSVLAEELTEEGVVKDGTVVDEETAVDTPSQPLKAEEEEEAEPPSPSPPSDERTDKLPPPPPDAPSAAVVSESAETTGDEQTKPTEEDEADMDAEEEEEQTGEQDDENDEEMTDDKLLDFTNEVLAEVNAEEQDDEAAAEDSSGKTHRRSGTRPVIDSSSTQHEKWFECPYTVQITDHLVCKADDDFVLYELTVTSNTRSSTEQTATALAAAASSDGGDSGPGSSASPPGISGGVSIKRFYRYSELFEIHSALLARCASLNGRNRSVGAIKLPEFAPKKRFTRNKRSKDFIDKRVAALNSYYLLLLDTVFNIPPMESESSPIHYEKCEHLRRLFERLFVMEPHEFVKAGDLTMISYLFREVSDSIKAAMPAPIGTVPVPAGVQGCQRDPHRTGLNMRDRSGATVLHYAVALQRPSIVQWLLHRASETLETINTKVVTPSRIRDRCIDISAKDDNLWTPLGLAYELAFIQEESSKQPVSGEIWRCLQAFYFAHNSYVSSVDYFQMHPPPLPMTEPTTSSSSSSSVKEEVEEKGDSKVDVLSEIDESKEASEPDHHAFEKSIRRFRPPVSRRLPLQYRRQLWLDTGDLMPKQETIRHGPEASSDSLAIEIAKRAVRERLSKSSSVTAAKGDGSAEEATTEKDEKESELMDDDIMDEKRVEELNAMAVASRDKITSPRHSAQFPTVIFKRERPKILVFVNPKSGPGRAKQYWDGLVKPLFDHVNAFDYEVCITTKQNEARDQIESIEDIHEKYDCIVSLGGDGTLSEIFQGLKLNRWKHFSNHQLAQQAHSKLTSASMNHQYSCTEDGGSNGDQFEGDPMDMPVGVLPGGSANDLAMDCYGGNNGILHSVRKLVDLKFTTIDLFEFRQRNSDGTAVDPLAKSPSMLGKSDSSLKAVTTVSSCGGGTSSSEKTSEVDHSTHLSPRDLNELSPNGDFYDIGFLSINWAVIAAVDFESERFRWMGRSRFDFQAFLEIGSGAEYRARVYYRPLSQAGSSLRPPESHQKVKFDYPGHSPSAVLDSMMREGAKVDEKIAEGSQSPAPMTSSASDPTSGALVAALAETTAIESPHPEGASESAFTAEDAAKGEGDKDGADADADADDDGDKPSDEQETIEQKDTEEDSKANGFEFDTYHTQSSSGADVTKTASQRSESRRQSSMYAVIREKTTKQDWWKELPKNNENPPEGWVRIEHKFGVLVATNLNKLGGYCFGGYDLSSNEGCLKLVYSVDNSRMHSVALFDKIEKGTHFSDECIFGFRTRELIFEPLETKPQLNLDGERRALTPTHVRVLPQRGMITC